ncbi:hypothetical protein D3C75_1300960 [compost metagenome]
MTTARLECTPVIDVDRSIVWPELSKGTVTLTDDATGTAGAWTVTVTVAGAEVPPGPVAL